MSGQETGAGAHPPLTCPAATPWATASRRPRRACVRPSRCTSRSFVATAIRCPSDAPPWGPSTRSAKPGPSAAQSAGSLTPEATGAHRPIGVAQSRPRMAIQSEFLVVVLEEPMTLYRGCHRPGRRALEAAMTSNYQAGRSDLRATALHMAVSMFEDPEVVAIQARRRPDRVGTHIARIELQPGRGICVADTGGPGHCPSGASPLSSQTSWPMSQMSSPSR